MQGSAPAKLLMYGISWSKIGLLITLDLLRLKATASSLIRAGCPFCVLRPHPVSLFSTVAVS